jgi:hypothetical protein
MVLAEKAFVFCAAQFNPSRPAAPHFNVPVRCRRALLPLTVVPAEPSFQYLPDSLDDQLFTLPVVSNTTTML